jgi:ankyrin repeat protein
MVSVRTYLLVKLFLLFPSNILSMYAEDQQLKERFYQYLEQHYLAGVKQCLIKGINPNRILVDCSKFLKTPDLLDGKLLSMHMRPLYYTIFDADLATTELLLKFGANPNTKDTNSKASPLYYALQFLEQDSHTPKLEGKSKFSSCSNQCSKQEPLNLSLLRLLLKYSSNPNFDLPVYPTPLTLAIRSGSLPVLKTLLLYDALPNLATGTSYPLTEAIGAGYNCPAKTFFPFIQTLIAYGANPNIRGSAKGRTKIESPLLKAAILQDKSLIKFLLYYGAHVHEADLGRTFNNYYRNSVAGWRAGLTLLLSFAPKGKLNPDIITRTLKNSLITAIFQGDVKAVPALLKSPDCSLRADKEFTALHWAAARGQTEIVKLLLEHSPDLINKPTSRPRKNPKTTPLDLAAFNGHIECVKFLEAQGGQYVRYNPLWWAIHNNKFEEVKNLLLTKIDVNKKDTYGNTPVHKAAFQHHAPFLKLLVQNGANLTIKNNVGITPLQLLSANRDPGDVGYVGEKILGPLLTVLSKSADPTAKVVGEMPELMYYIGGFLAQAHYQALPTNQKLPIKKVLLLDTYAALKVTTSL